MTIQKTIENLSKGNARFVQDKLNNAHQDSSRRAELTEGQQPHTIVLSCADSRVVPEFAFDTGLGELFVVRVAGNVANPSSIASIEYAVLHLGSKVIVVLGHQSCGAVTAAVQGGDNGPNLNHLLAFINPAIQKSRQGATVNEIVKVNAYNTIDDLLSKSKAIQNAVNKGSLKIIPAYYNLDTGKIDFLEV